MAKMLEKTHEEMTKWHFVQICGSYIQHIDDVDEHISSIGCFKIKRRGRGYHHHHNKIRKKVVNVVTQMPTKVPQKLQT